MHLDYSTSHYKGKTYTSYRIVRSVRKGKKVRKQTLFTLGSLTEQQATQIRLILRTVKKPDEVLVVLNDVIPTCSVRYLDVVIANYLWDYWDLDLAFNNGTESILPTRQIARILTTNRCISPCSHYAIPRWVEQTVLPDLLDLPLSKLNDDKIYYELDRIEEHKEQIESHLFERTRQQSPESYNFVNYDLTTSYFVGIRCSLSRFGKSKDNQAYQRQVLLGLVVNAQGYPFKWDVFPGNQAEVHTLEDNINAYRKLGLPVTMVFDRGLVSKKNLDVLLADPNLKFISALDKPQIPKVPGIDLQPFASLAEKAVEQQIKSWPGFKRFDDKVFYRDLGINDGIRHILSINIKLMQEEQKLRCQKFHRFAQFLKELNAELKTAQRDRNLKATRNKVQTELKKLKLKRFFYEPVLKAITVKHRTAKDRYRTVASFQVEIDRDVVALTDAKRLDGLCVFISNHVERQGSDYAMDARAILQAYRDKTEIEDAFKNMKSLVKLRPFFVNTEQHVRAVFTICVLAYHLNKTLARMRKEIEGYDYLNSKELYEPFRASRLVTIKDPATGLMLKKVIPPSPETRSLLKRLGLYGLIQSSEEVVATEKN